MRNTLSIFLAVICASKIALATEFYIAPAGNDANPGTIGSPFATIGQAITKAKPGDVLYLRGGTYNISSQINITPAHSGTSAAPIRLWAYSGEKPLLNFISQPAVTGGLRGFYLTGDYWHFKGFEIYGAADNGIKIEGNYNVMEQLVISHCGDSGIQLGFGHDTNKGNPGNLCAYNKIINCDSYFNYDFDNYGADADGFACKMHNGKGNVFYGCRAWENADDAWDLFETDWPVEIHHCWAWGSGRKIFLEWHAQRTGKTTTSFQGNGNGIKLGGDGAGGNSVGTHIISHCVAFGNNKTTSVKGFDQNSHKGGLLLHHCLAWDNGYNYMFETSPTSGNTNIFRNNVSIRGTRNDYEIEPAGAVQQSNSWNLTPGILAQAGDYVTLTEVSAKAPRQANGALPNNGFARLVAGSDLIDKGLRIDSIRFAGAGPDLGPYEYGQVTATNDYFFSPELSYYPNPFAESVTVQVPGSFTYEVYNLSGKLIEKGAAADMVRIGEQLSPDSYLVKVMSCGYQKTVKVNKEK